VGENRSFGWKTEMPIFIHDNPEINTRNDDENYPFPARMAFARIAHPV
jgi:hypothetical protein